MEAIPDAVRIGFVAALSALLLAATLAPTAAEEYVQERIRIYYDPTVEPHLLHAYRLRILVVGVPAGVEECWSRLPNGTLQTLCKPVENATVKVWYLELKELREAYTGPDGVAEAEFRLFTPTASFKVEVYSGKGYGETLVRVEARPWMLLTMLSFASMMALLTYSARRGFW